MLFQPSELFLKIISNISSNCGQVPLNYSHTHTHTHPPNRYFGEKFYIWINNRKHIHTFYYYVSHPWSVHWSFLVFGVKGIWISVFHISVHTFMRRKIGHNFDKGSTTSMRMWSKSPLRESSVIQKGAFTTLTPETVTKDPKVVFSLLLLTFIQDFIQILIHWTSFL